MTKIVQTKYHVKYVSEVCWYFLNPIGSFHKKFGKVLWCLEANIERLVYHLFLVLKLDKVLKEDACELFVKSPQPHHINNTYILVFKSYHNLISRPLIFLSCLISMESMWNPLSMKVLRKIVFNVNVLKPLWNILVSVPEIPKKLHYNLNKDS